MKKRIILRYTKKAIDKPIVYRLAVDYNLVVNILRANVSPRADSMMVLELEGTEQNFKQGLDYLKNLNINIEPIEQDISRDEVKCVQCGLCTSVCAPGALSIADRKSMKVKFDYHKCVACEMCVKVCPVKAMSVSFD